MVTVAVLLVVVVVTILLVMVVEIFVSARRGSGDHRFPRGYIRDGVRKRSPSP